MFFDAIIGNNMVSEVENDGEVGLCCTNGIYILLGNKFSIFECRRMRNEVYIRVEEEQKCRYYREKGWSA